MNTKQTEIERLARVAFPQYFTGPLLAARPENREQYRRQAMYAVTDVLSALKEPDGIYALMAAGNTAMCKQKGERDTEFVKRIVCAYASAILEEPK